MIEDHTTELVDFHCHLDLYPDHLGAINHREQEEVFTLAVTTTPKAFPRNKELTQSTRHVHAALGLHPQLISERAHEISLWLDYWTSTRYVGEVGLDAGPRFYNSFDNQKAIFEKILIACSDAGEKILSVHSVRASRIVLDMIEARLSVRQGRVVLHCFTGSASDARRAIDLGCFFSINNKMLESERMRKLIELLPTDRLLTVTDGLFTELAPASVPADVSLARDNLATLLGIERSFMSKIISDNLHSVLN